MAVFYRTNALSRVMEETLRRAGVPYVIARGTAFYQRKEIKDALAYLKTIANPHDEISLRRIVNLPARGISKQTMDRLDRFAIHGGFSIFEALRRVQDAPALNPRAVNSVKKFVSMLIGWQQEAHETPLPTDNGDEGAAAAGRFADYVRRVLGQSGLEKHYRKLAVSDEELQRVENLSELVSSASDFALQWHAADEDAGGVDRERPEQPTLLDLLRAWLEQVSLVADVDALNAEVGALSLMTLHAAKGLEFPAVAMIGLEEGLLPHGRSQESEDGLEEERRLCFVGMTRAEEHLLITCSRQRTVRGVSQSAIASRFLNELPRDTVIFSDQSEDAYDFEDETRDELLERTRSQYPKGSMVRHPQFGVGRVDACVPGGYVKVAFPSVGVKTLAIDYARLERVD
jgi:DNA helicase-2/ATP-dependent DNA helicase PcrA